MCDVVLECGFIKQNSETRSPAEGILLSHYLVEPSANIWQSLINPNARNFYVSGQFHLEIYINKLLLLKNISGFSIFNKEIFRSQYIIPQTKSHLNN